MSAHQLDKISTRAPGDLDKRLTKGKFQDITAKLNELQHVLYAEHKHSLLIVLQGMDAAGKDGLVREVFSSVNPLGANVKGFKKPTDEEMSHDFLWRIHRHAPEKGMIQIFNRSHYEDVLIQRVHKWIDMDTVHERYEHINNFEKLLQANGTHILKFHLHVSQEEQMERLQERLTNPMKKWKYNPSDMEERKHWDTYMEAYQDVFKYCGPENHWTILPADQNWYKEFLFASAVVKKLESLDMNYPNPKI